MICKTSFVPADYKFRYPTKAVEVSHDPGEFDTSVLLMNVGHL